MLLKGETLEETIEWAWRQEPPVQGLHELLHAGTFAAARAFSAA
jgi:hypothetical protein